MSRVKRSLLFITCLVLFPVVVFAQTKPAQQPSPPPRGEAEDVIKFETSLVQTDVMVFDKNGRPVLDLKPEQFRLKIILPGLDPIQKLVSKCINRNCFL